MRSWLKIHSVFTLTLLLFYVACGVFGGFDVLGNDLKAKVAWAAGSTISVTVNALPGQPMVSSNETCVADVSTIDLNWIGSEGATSFAVVRDGLTLASGFVSPAFTDSNVIAGVDYSYVIKASGAGGDSFSDPLLATAKDCTFLLSDLPILSFGGGVTASYSQIANQIGWVLASSAIALIFFGSMFMIEYYFMKEAIFTVGELDLSKRGMVPRKRKEVWQ